MQPDGKILVKGYSNYLSWGYPGAPGDESYGYEQNHSVIRLNADVFRYELFRLHRRLHG